ncbi:NucA/NucB deoxyribonuclease domain-containing protein [Nonomuraea angiospora]
MPSGLQKASCDELPFASTHEGAAFAGYNISVAIIECKYNNAAGALLNGWYDRHRILEKDPFGSMRPRRATHLPKMPLRHTVITMLRDGGVAPERSRLPRAGASAAS